MIYCQFHKAHKVKNRVFNLNVKACFKAYAINAIYGPSGGGKTSLLRIISGLDKIDSGKIKANDECWVCTEENIFLPLAERNIAYVFQDYALFPNMTVLQNLEFVKKEINQNLLKDVIETLEINDLLKSKPNELSGGQQQRVALARALVQEPELLLLDEPFTALHEELRNKLQGYLLTLQKRYRFTVIMVSHNLQEVLTLAEHVCMLDKGEVVGQGHPSLLLTCSLENTLKAKVLNKHAYCLNVLVGTQLIKVSKEQVVTENYEEGDVVELKIS